MFHKSKTMVFFLILIFSLSACGVNNNTRDDRQVNLYIGVKDRESLNMISYVVDEYRKANPQTKFNINNSIGEKIDGGMSDNGNTDVAFISRTDMLSLARKGILSDMRNLYRENNLNERYYGASRYYGRFNDRYYGIALLPYTIEILCNEKAFSELNLKVPNSMDEFMNSLKVINSTGKSVPVVLNEDMDINTILFSMVSNNLVTARKLENIYDSGPSAYKSLGEIQGCFDSLENMVKNGYINEDTFEIGSKSTLKNFEKDNIPAIITSSYYLGDIRNPSIKCVEYKNPVMADVIISTPVNDKNTDGVDDFIKFILSDGVQKKLFKKGFVTGDKKVNVSGGNVNKSVMEHLKNSTENDMAIIYNLPKNFRYNISKEIDDIFSGKYSGSEWNETVEKSY